MVNIYNAKSILLGDPAVGKTSIRRTYMGQAFQTSQLTTIGADFTKEEIQIDEASTVKMQIWDINGDKTIHTDPDTFRVIRSKYFVNSNICFMVFDLTRRSTFKNIHIWLEQFWKVNSDPDIPLLLIGNKADLQNQISITKEEIHELLEALRNYNQTTPEYVTYITTSAATGLNIQKAFYKVANQIIEIYERKYSAHDL